MTTYVEVVGSPFAHDGKLGVPSVPTVTGLTCEDKVTGALHRVTLTFTNVAFALTDVAATVAYSGMKVLDMPSGAYAILGAVSDFALTKSSAGVNADWDGDFGVGTVTASNNATLSSTEQNIIPTTATPQAVSGATTADGVMTAALYLDGTATASDIYVNFLVDDVDHNVNGTACNLIVNGTLTITYLYMGDN